MSQGALVCVAGKLELTVGVTEAWMIVMGLFGLILILMAFYHLRMLPSGGASTKVESVSEAFSTFKDIVKSFFKKKNIMWGLAFIVLFRFAEGQITKIVPLFLRATPEEGGLGLLTSDIGIAYGVFGAVAFVAGSLLGGYFVARRG